MSSDTPNAGAPHVEATGLRLSGDAETEAHWFRRDIAETEAHARLALSFPPEMGEATFQVTYRPPTTPGAEPEVELHRFSASDRRLKRDVRPI